MPPRSAPPPPPPPPVSTRMPAAPTAYFPPAPAAAVNSAVPHRTDHARLLALLGGGMGGLVLLIVIIAIVATPGRHNNACPPSCPHPPVGPAVAAPHSYHSTDSGFALDYDDSGHPAVDQSSKGVTLQYGNGNFETEFVGLKANGANAQQVVDSVVHQLIPSATQAYELPGAYVGYMPGYGAAYDMSANSSSGGVVQLRFIVVAAVQKDLAVVTVEHGPYVKSEPGSNSDFNDGHPTPSGLPVAIYADSIINTVRWPGQPAR